MFEALQNIYDKILIDETEWRNELIKFLGTHNPEEEEFIQYSELINHLIRMVWLYPYMDIEKTHWTDEVAYNSFSIDLNIPWSPPAVMHREQSDILKMLLEWENVIVSAPTSFGKSYIIDAFISIKSPDNVLIIVPTIALMNEMRRRIQKKFSNKYKIITGVWEELAPKNIFIFPQERALSYIDQITSLDLFVVDEFYKASSKNDKERSSSLQKSILRLSKKSKQRYFLAPNITNIADNKLIEWMILVNKMYFNTVFLDVVDYTQQDITKEERIANIIKNETIGEKSLIYAWTYKEINTLTTLILTAFEETNSEILAEFSEWLWKNYTTSWSLPNLIKRWFWIHNWRLHRSISQIQVKLLEEVSGIDNLISTSSIIEWVNTSAKNVILWKSKINWNRNLDEFSYRNIIGRWWRMFKYFIWKIFLLDKTAPQDSSTQLSIDLNESVLLDEFQSWEDIWSEENQRKMIDIKNELDNLLWRPWAFYELTKDDKIQVCTIEQIKAIINNIREEPDSWNGLAFLNSLEPDNWERFIKKFYFLMWWHQDFTVNQVLKYCWIAKDNWSSPLSVILRRLNSNDIDIEKVFNIEKFISYKFSAFISDAVQIYNFYNHSEENITSFISYLSNLFLPPIVYHLEEYWLPRTISMKIQLAWLINFAQEDIAMTDIISKFKEIWIENFENIPTLDNFDKYILKYFMEWI